MKILVTGGTGFIGKTFLEKLVPAIREGDRIFVLSRTNAYFKDKRIEVISGSLTDIKIYEKVLLECEYVFHLAANAAFSGTVDYDKDNYEPTKNIVEILKKSSKIKLFVFTSTIGAVDRMAGDDCSNPLNTRSKPNPTSRYGVSKQKAEEYIRSASVPYTIIRPTWVYGRNMRGNSHINKFASMVFQNFFYTFKIIEA